MHSAHTAGERHRRLSDPHAPRTRGREHEELEAFVGTWRVSGHNAAVAATEAGGAVTGEQIYEWLPGRFFLASCWHRRFASGAHVGTGVLGFDPDTGAFYAHHFDNLGFARRYRLTLRGRVWTLAGPWERGTIAFGPHGDSFTETWEISGDGARWRPLCELEATRARHSREHLVRTYLGAYPAGDRDALAQLLAGGFRFTSPDEDAGVGIDAATYFERCWPSQARARSLAIEDLAVVGDEAFVTYRLVTRDGAEVRNTERLTFDGDRIASVEVFRGAVHGEGGAVRPMRRE
jgi:ketosteroid isomerase-like protein